MTEGLTIGQQTFDREALQAWAETAAPADLSENALAALDFCRRWVTGEREFVIHSSGSTGAPKPIVLRRDQMVASARATGEALGLRAGMHALVCLPVRYIAGQMMLVRGLVLGLPLTVVEPAGDPLAELPAEADIDFTAVVPLQLQTLLDGPHDYVKRLNRMRAILVGGAPINARLEERIASLAVPVYHTYGMTETATHIALRRLNGPGASPSFHPLPGVELDTDGRGCLRVKGPMTLDQWLQTNDLVELLAGGVSESAFRWLGRWDNVINSGGFKVPVEKVEAAVDRVWPSLQLPGRQVFVAGLPDERLGQMVTLVIEGKPLAARDEARLLASLRQMLDRYESPRRILYLARFFETATGKIDRARSLSALESEDSQRAGTT